MMKRFFSIFLALMLVVSMTACGGTKAEKEEPATETETSEPAPETKPSGTQDDGIGEAPSGIQDDGMGEDPAYGEGIGEVIALSEEEKAYVAGQNTLSWLELSQTEKDDLVVLTGRWLEDDSGFIVPDYDELVAMLDNQTEKYFRNGVNEDIIVTVCSIYGIAVPADVPARPSGTQDDGIGEAPSGIQDDGMGEDPDYGEGIGEVVALSKEEKAYVAAQDTNTWLDLSQEKKDDLVVLIGRWLEDDSGFIVENYDDLVIMLDRQMEQYFKNGVNEGVLATVCDICGSAIPKNIS